MSGGMQLYYTFTFMQVKSCRWKKNPLKQLKMKYKNLIQASGR